VSNTFERNTSVAASVSTSIGFAMMCVGKFMAILDVQVVATSLPTIQSALDIPPDQMSWVQTACLIAEVVAVPSTSGRGGIVRSGS
jgi:MFS transporter, DHA2 family, multidrug resistance protein